MKLHPRIRKTIKWGGAAVTVLMVVVWIGSGWVSVAQGGGDGSLLALDEGRLEIIAYNDLGLLTAYQQIPPWREGGIVKWELSLGCSWTSDAVRTRIRMPLWLPALACLMPTAFAWRLDTLARRRAKLNLCAKCNYDRTGLASKDAKCPECGAAPDARA